MKKKNLLSKQKQLYITSRKYIQRVKNIDIAEMHKTIYNRYLAIEDINNIPNKKQMSEGYLIKHQKRSEVNRLKSFYKKSVICRNSIFVSNESQLFIKILDQSFDMESIKKGARKIFINFKSVMGEEGYSAVFLHLSCSILHKRDFITLSNYRTQLKNVFKKQYLFISSEKMNKCFFDVVKISEWYQFADIVIGGLIKSNILYSCKKLGPGNRKHLIEYIKLSDTFLIQAAAYDYKASKMPLISKPDAFSQDRNGGFLVHKKELIIYNKEKSAMTRIDDNIISNINYLQSIPYKICKKKLNEI